MHELSLAQRIVEIVHESIGRHAPQTVRTISLEIGELANVHVDSLTFAFEALVEGTNLQTASLQITSVRVQVLCKSCGTFSTVDGVTFECPRCGSTTLDVRRGRELDITSIEIDDYTEVNHGNSDR
ncbi:MAG: hydrogenase maturation nickel metallochaperone HypA [Ignavibacteria bacterium]|nr:hydrogenase maturation nickel metallochaperone HypA [Ignavibacteria bacterium]